MSEDTVKQCHEAVSSKLPDATVEVTIGTPEHYSAAMITAEFPGKTSFARQCLIDSAHLMGDVSVHTVDEFVTCVAK